VPSFLQSRGVKQTFLIVAFLLSVVIIFMTYSRTAWVGLLVMAVAFYVFFKYKGRVKIIHGIGLVVSFLCVIGLLYYIKPESAKGRLLNYLVSYELWQHAPFFGIGWNDFSHSYNQFQAS